MSTILASSVVPGLLSAMAPLVGAAHLRAHGADYVLLGGLLGVTCFRKTPGASWVKLWDSHAAPADWGGAGGDRLYGVAISPGGTFAAWGFNAIEGDLWVVFSGGGLGDEDLISEATFAAALQDPTRLPGSVYTSVQEDNDLDEDGVDLLYPVLKWRTPESAYLALTSAILVFPEVRRRPGEWAVWAAPPESVFAESASFILPGGGVIADMAFDGETPVVLRRLSIDRGGRTGMRLDLCDPTFRGVAFSQTFDNTRIRLMVLPSRTLASQAVHLGSQRTAPEDE